jgi:hypothetical protein
MKTVLRFFILLLVSFSFTFLVNAQVTSITDGNWGDNSTWSGGAVPGPGDNVIISESDTVEINVDAVCNNLSINGLLQFEDVTVRSLTVNGNFSVSITGKFKTKSVAVGPIVHTLTIYGNFVSETVVDVRSGSNPNVGVCDITFTGSGNTEINIPSSSDINAITINKSGTGKVILLNTIMQNNNSTTAPSPLVLTHGIIETNEFEWHVKSTSSSAGVQGGSPESHIRGNLVRYMPSGTPEREYPMGDGENYRPVTVSLLSSVSNSGLKCSVVHADANTGSSTFTGNIDKVSTLRYFAFHNLSNNNLLFKYFQPSYGTDDGVESGNTDLRVALSVDERATWIDKGPGDGSHTTTLTNPPVYIKSDSLDPAVTVSGQGKFYITIARKTGTTTNPLPVELTSFTASSLNGSVILEWSTASETGNRGYEIERSTDKISFIMAGFVNGSGTTSETKRYSFTDAVSGISGTVYYRLKQLDFDGSFNYSDIAAVNIEQPENYKLSQNYPNPFNPSTVISYQLAEAGNVSLNIYDVLGNLVKSVVSEYQEAGSYTNTVNFDGLSSGTYIYELKVNSFVSRNKMLFLK